MDVRSARQPANRAVAALQSASNTVTSASPLLALPPTRRSTAPVVRYNSFDALCQAQHKPDENAELRTQLLRRLPQPAPRDEVAVMGNQVTVRILDLLDPLSTDAAAFSETCRAVRESLLRATNLEAVVVVPAMASASALTAETVQETLCTFFVARGSEVRSLALCSVGEAEAQHHQRGETPTTAPVPLRLPAPWALKLVSYMPYLTELDLRHVQWCEAKASQVLPYLFNDLHIANVGTLRTLKVDPDVMQHWTPGWWRRHPNLRAITVGSRYSFANGTNISSTSTSSPSSFSSSPSLLPLELPSDYCAMMREDGRRWRLELWCPLRASSIAHLFCPAAGVSFPGVEELLVNVRHNERVCESAEHGGDNSGGGGAGTGAAAGGESTFASAGAAAAAEAPADAKSHTKGRKAQAAADVPEVVIAYPRLHTVAIADVSERPEGAAEMYQAMAILAPEMRHFNVCDTVLIGAGVAESGKGERAKRGGGGGGGALKNVN